MEKIKIKTYTKSGRKAFESLIGNRVKSRVFIFADKYLNKNAILQILTGLTLIILLIYFGLIMLVAVHFSSMVIQSAEDIPEDYKTAIIYLDSKSIDEDFWELILDTVLSLEKEKRFDKIILYIENYDVDILNYINRYFNKNNVTIDDYYPSLEDLHSTMKSKYKADKVVIFSANRYLIRLSYSFAINDILAKVYKTSDEQSVFNLAQIFSLGNDILRYNI